MSGPAKEVSASSSAGDEQEAARVTGGLGKRRLSGTTIVNTAKEGLYSESSKRKKEKVTVNGVRNGTRLEGAAVSSGSQIFSPSLRAHTMETVQNGRPCATGRAGPKKKLVIKQFKVKPKLPEDFEASSWEKLREAIVAVHTKKPVTSSREDLYQAVEDLCKHKMSESLYKRLHDECEAHIIDVMDSLLGATPDYAAFLSLVNETWKDHCEHMLNIRNIFLYLDRTYVIQLSSARSLWDMGLQLFRKHLTERPEVQKKLIPGLLSLIDKERRGETISRELVKDLVRMLVSLQMYESQFEEPFLKEARLFYAAEGKKYMEQTPVREFLRHVEKRLVEANQRVLHYLDLSTRRPLVHVVEDFLLRPHVSAILEKGFDQLMDENAVEDLKRMYGLLGRVDGLEEMKASWNVYIRRCGLEIVSDPEKEKDMVDLMLQFKAKLDALLELAFSSHEAYVYSLKEAFEYFINARQSRPAELIAKYLDSRLRSGGKGSSEDEMEVVLDKVMVLFRYIQGKDVFEAFYKKDLAKRLLLGKSASFDLEKTMISKLKTECGNSFTNKLEGMFKDIDLSRDIVGSFNQHAPSQRDLVALGSPKIDMSVQVLTTGFWPAYPAMEINLPNELSKRQEIFKQFYLSKHNGRRLLWQHSLAHCVVKAHFPKGRKELSVSLFQTLCLLCFNQAEQLSYQQIKETTGIETKELDRTLQSLACGKVRVLTKSPKGRDVGKDDVFHFNKDFSNKLMRIKINTIQLKETVEEAQDTHERVFRDRQYQVDAAIVRIMKARKKLSHALLMAELFNQLRFPAKPSDLKKRIESLIDREYLERDEDNPQVYNYLA